MIDQASVPSLMGSTVRDDSGEKIGKVAQVYLDDTTGQPEWVTVRTGLFGMKESFVPLAAARVEGDELVVDVPKDRVTDAPKIDEDGHLSEEQEHELYSYYGVSPAGFVPETGPTEGYATNGRTTGYADATDETAYAPSGVDGAADRDPTGLPAGEATTRDEEPLGTEPEAVRRARLRKYAATDTGRVDVDDDPGTHRDR